MVVTFLEEMVGGGPGNYDDDSMTVAATVEEVSSLLVS